MSGEAFHETPPRKGPAGLGMALRLYGAGWRAALPFLRRNPRLAEGFRQRVLREPPGRADLWIQGASAGECYLAVQLMTRLAAAGRCRILATTNTRQGKEILDRGAGGDPDPAIRTAFFPFDHPALMARALEAVRPGGVVLLESEIWPGLLRAAGERHIPVLIVNGRMTRRSFDRYRIWPALWRFLGPDRVLAISERDADRFAGLFGPERVSVMSNMKFDRVALPSGEGAHSVSAVIPSAAPFAVLGSVRQEEEGPAGRIIGRLIGGCPRAVIGLFPRHMERIAHWKGALDGMAVPWRLRSEVRGPVPPGTVLLWDRFGELTAAYERASAAFVGGSLAPLGGQNVLEPMMAGVAATIGPSWENFAWVGGAAVAEGLVRVCRDADGVAETLLADLAHPPDRSAFRRRALAYVRRRQGGTETACGLIRQYLNHSKRKGMGS